MTQSRTDRALHLHYRLNVAGIVLAMLLLGTCICTQVGADIDSSHEKSKETDKLKKEHDPKQELGGETASRPQKKAFDRENVLKDDAYRKLLEPSTLDVGFIHAFIASISIIIVSEIGDKTFFIAAIMAMRHSRLTVFFGAMTALGLMTVLSALLGFATTVIPKWLTNYVSAGLFVIFGVKMLREGYYMNADEGQEEYEEVKEDLRKKDEEADKQGIVDVETGIMRTPQRQFLYSFFSRAYVQSVTLTFLAEWGDRSQISTIILAAREDVVGVILGGTIGHAFCTGLAVLGGRFIAQRISIRTVTLVGGVVFLIFALSTFIIDPYE